MTRRVTCPQHALLEELGLEYVIKRYERDSTGLAPKELLEVHPLGKSPVITDGSITVAESGAIVEYLVGTYGNGRLIPPASDAEARRRYTYWLHYAEGSVMPAVVLKLLFTKMVSGSPWLLRPLVGMIAGAVQSGYVDPQLKLHSDFIESELAKREWFCGDEFTAPDVLMSFPVEGLAHYGSVGPKTKAYLERLKARPAYKAALEKGGPLEML
ncbi:hypothetical protein WJX72_006702 [[Myrmecia] bisecta]|uniref:GST N-terminal domain-containing protein n=1 Tax=[Myrmecia] bisecta TaxID=41462 RepID=A0AAW1PW29_9CHLO